MQVIDPGHEYMLDHLDGRGEELTVITFVKRIGEKFPGNTGDPHGGTTMQEVLRVLIDRANYVNNQISCDETSRAIEHMKLALYQFELRAARRHGRDVDFSIEDAVAGTNKCGACGHVGCKEEHNEPRR